MSVLSPDLCAWLAPGLAGMIAAVDRSGRPQLARVWALRAANERDVIEVYVQRAASQALVESLSNGGRAALNLIEVTTYRSRMFKGACEVSTHEPDSAFLDENLAALNRAFHSVGMPSDAAHRMLWHSEEPTRMVELRLSVDSVFDQSPKPGAGARL